MSRFGDNAHISILSLHSSSGTWRVAQMHANSFRSDNNFGTHTWANVFVPLA